MQSDSAEMSTGPDNTGFKSLLDQLDERQLERFKADHLKGIHNSANNVIVELSADTLFGAVNLCRSIRFIQLYYQ
ncbi:MAG: hypothetical protein JAZ21_18035 [Candidatus Thiodiazotropha taylori]|nr:hypothetical protein [Candidatus Thiodiazotropha taylori]